MVVSVIAMDVSEREVFHCVRKKEKKRGLWGGAEREREREREKIDLSINQQIDQ